jgi:hypothetical protein
MPVGDSQIAVRASPANFTTSPPCASMIAVSRSK